MKRRALSLIALSLLVLGCNVSHVTEEQLLQAQDLEEFNRYAEAAEALGADAM